MGSRPKVNKTDLAYIAGFLDGDGSLMIKEVIRKRFKENSFVYL